MPAGINCTAVIGSSSSTWSVAVFAYETVGLMDLALAQCKGGIELAIEGRKEVAFQQEAA